MNNSKTDKQSKDTLFKSDNSKTKEVKQQMNRVQKTVLIKQEYSEFKEQTESDSVSNFSKDSFL